MNRPCFLLVAMLAMTAAGCAGIRATAAADAPAVSDASALPAVPNVAQPAPGVISAGRIGGDDLAGLRAAGVRHVIDLTPDAETPGFDEAAAVRAAGMGYSNLPLRGADDLTPANVQRFDALLREADRPVLVHCASSNRVGAVAALRAAWVDGLDAEAAIEVGRRWGLKGLEPAVRERLDAGPSR